VHSEPRPGRQPRIDLAELTGLRAAAQDVFDPSFVVTATAAEALGPCSCERRKLVQEDPHVVRVAVDDVEQFAAEQGELL
jgi:hypothetical protein